MAPLRVALSLACLAVASTTCARHRAASTTTILLEWSLTVENHHWLDVNVYVVHNGQSTRVGLVTATTSQSFVLPTYLLGAGGDIQLVATPIGGGRSIVTGVITLAGGQTVDWTLERALSHSSFSVH